METVKMKRRAKKKERSPRKERQRLRREEGMVPDIRARLNHLRVAPRKARLIADMVRGQDVDTAQQILEFSHRAVAGPMLTLLNSAIANAKNEDDRLDETNLYIDSIWVDAGRTLHRFRPRAMGRASRIKKRMCHITLVLKEKE